MQKNPSIKEARKHQNLSLEFVARELKLETWIIKNIEDGIKLRGIYSHYESSYINSINKLLGIPIYHPLKKIIKYNNDSQNLIIIYFLIFLFFSVASITNYIIVNFNKLNQINNFSYIEDDSILAYKKDIKKTDINFLTDSSFIDYLIFEKNSLNNQFLIINTKTDRETYYKIKYLNVNKESFGRIKPKNRLVFNFKMNLIIDITDVSAIDSIIFNGKKYNNINENRYYLKNFDINELYKLK